MRLAQFTGVLGVFLLGAVLGWMVRDQDIERRTASDTGSTHTPGTAAPPPATAITTPLAEDLDRLLTRGQLDPAIERLAAAKRHAGDDEIEAAGRVFLFHVQKRDLGGAKSSALALLRRYLDVMPEDVDAYVLLAALHNRASRYGASLEAMASAVLAADGAQEARYLEEFDHLLNLYVKTSRQGPTGQVDMERLERIGRILSWHDPVALELARAYISQRDFGRAAGALQDIDPNGPLALQRERLMFQIEREIEYDDPFESTVELTRSGRHYIVDVTLVDEYDEMDLRLLLDTGASMTLITTQAAAALGIEVAEIETMQRLNTPGGQVVAPVYELDAMAVGREMIWNVPVAIVPLQIGADVDGLIGMDFLGRFEFQIDQGRSELVLSRR